jgi:ABC-type branched-subunit amino acid transport system substrate-binding protein
LYSSLFFVIFALVLFYSYSFIKNYQKISIAFVGPLSGNGAAAGQLMVQAIQLYLDSINKQGVSMDKKFAWMFLMIKMIRHWLNNEH